LRLGAEIRIKHFADGDTVARDKRRKDMVDIVRDI
jgi:hypothetical protein